MVECTGRDILTVICCIIVPPLGIYLKSEKFDADFWIALILWLFLFTWPIAVIFAIGYFFEMWSCAGNIKLNG
ncbi:hypothetical protein NFJ02_24g56420 [Pycnococcus provasolii]